MKRTLSIIIPLLLAVSLIVFIVNGRLDHKEQIKAKRAEEKAIARKLTSTIDKLIKTYDAVDWDKEIKNNYIRKHRRRILTLDLEQLLSSHSKILFIGEIKDISAFDGDSYIVKLGNVYWVEDYKLEANCPKQKIDSLLREHPDVINEMFEDMSCVAIIADIDKIERSNDEKQSVILKGKCTDIVYLKDCFLLDVYESTR